MRIAAALLLVIACDTTGPPHHSRAPTHIFQAHAETIHDSLYSSCAISGTIPAQLTSVPPWYGKALVGISRSIATTHGDIVSRQITVSIPFTVTQNDTVLVLTLGAPVDTTLTGSLVHTGSDPTSGTWTCPTSLPFLADSLLRSKGYDPEPPPSGIWSLRWVNPVD